MAVDLVAEYVLKEEEVQDLNRESGWGDEQSVMG
jgi:hypothetical protein